MAIEWYGVKIYIENEEKRLALLLNHIKSFKEEFQDKLHSYHFFRYTWSDGRYVRFRFQTDEPYYNILRQELKKRLDELIDTVIISYEMEPYSGEEFSKLFEYGAEAFFTFQECCQKFTPDEASKQYYQQVQRLLHLFFNPLGFNYFGENQVCLDKIYGNISLMHTNSEIGSRGATMEMLKYLYNGINQIFEHFKQLGYEIGKE